VCKERLVAVLVIALNLPLQQLLSSKFSSSITNSSEISEIQAGMMLAQVCTLLKSKWSVIILTPVILLLTIETLQIDVNYYTTVSKVNTTINATSKASNKTTIKTPNDSYILAQPALKTAIIEAHNETPNEFKKIAQSALKIGKTHPIKIPAKIGFIHIGKTAGTTASKMIKYHCFRKNQPSCNAYHSKLKKENRFFIPNETSISLKTKDYYHIRKPNIAKYDSFVVTVRHPVDRMVSWYLFFHPENKIRASGSGRVRKHELYECYGSIDLLASVGLRNRTYSTGCERLAQNCTVGKLPYCEHLYYNYEFYIGDLIKTNKQLFILRTEYFWNDWVTINTMLDHNHSSIHKIESHVFKEVSDLNVRNKTISMEGRRNVCYWLCEEIQLYKKLLWRGVNLNDGDREVSLSRINDTCPEETMLPLDAECR